MPEHNALDSNSPTLIYVHDPMCSWCWGFAPNYEKLAAQLPAGLNIVRLTGGLAPDSDQPMPLAMQQSLQQTWQAIAQKIPDTQFNFEFWTNCQPRRSTWPACRAVIAARMQAPQWDEMMTRAIQHAYYLHARNPSDDETLIEIAAEIGMNQQQFADNLASDEVAATLAQEIDFTRRIGVHGFPSLVLLLNDSTQPIAVDYLQVQPMLNAIHNAYTS